MKAVLVGFEKKLGNATMAGARERHAPSLFISPQEI